MLGKHLNVIIGDSIQFYSKYEYHPESYCIVNLQYYKPGVGIDLSELKIASIKQISFQKDNVLHGYGDCIRLTAWCAGDRITSFSGDGIILSTPTGSTGYSMSAGGPIVEPEASAIIVSPICAHMMSARSYVLGASHDVTVLAEKLHGRRAYISVDGNSVMDLANGDLLRVRRSERCILMADMGLKSFFDLAFEKLT